MRLCKVCSNRVSKLWDKAHPERRKARGRAWRKKNPKYFVAWRKKNPEKAILLALRNNAKSREIAFDLTLSDMVFPKICPVLGIKFETRKGRLHALSVDRIKPHKGYTKGNIQFMSGLANSMKSCATPKQLVKFAEWVLKTYGPKRLPSRVSRRS